MRRFAPWATSTSTWPPVVSSATTGSVLLCLQNHHFSAGARELSPKARTGDAAADDHYLEIRAHRGAGYEFESRAV